MSQLDEWISYVGDPSLFDKHHFESLIEQLQTEHELHNAFDRVPGGADFVKRLLWLRSQTDPSGVYLHPSMQRVSEKDLASAAQYSDAVFDRLSEIGDPDAQFIKSVPIESIAHKDFQVLKASRSLPLLNAKMSISNDFIDVTVKLPEWFDGLYEAVYMMTTIPEVSRYLLAPVSRYPLDERPAAELWLRGHRVDFCEDRTILIVGGG